MVDGVSGFSSLSIGYLTPAGVPGGGGVPVQAIQPVSPQPEEAYGKSPFPKPDAAYERLYASLSTFAEIDPKYARLYYASLPTFAETDAKYARLLSSPQEKSSDKGRFAESDAAYAKLYASLSTFTR